MAEARTRAAAAKAARTTLRLAELEAARAADAQRMADEADGGVDARRAAGQEAERVEGDRAAAAEREREAERVEEGDRDEAAERERAAAIERDRAPRDRDAAGDLGRSVRDMVERLERMMDDPEVDEDRLAVAVNKARRLEGRAVGTAHEEVMVDAVFLAARKLRKREEASERASDRASAVGGAGGGAAVLHMGLPELPTFSGGPDENYREFLEIVTAYVVEARLPPVQSFTTLRQRLRGEALRQVQGVGADAGAWRTAKALLDAVYDRPERQAMRHWQALLDLPHLSGSATTAAL